MTIKQIMHSGYDEHGNFHPVREDGEVVHTDRWARVKAAVHGEIDNWRQQGLWIIVLMAAVLAVTFELFHEMGK